MTFPALLPHRPSVPIVLGTVLLLLLPGCSLFESESEPPETVYPMYVDANGNEVNDYVEASTHRSGDEAENASGKARRFPPPGPARGDHAFVDENEDGICDFAQNGSATWHGPGYVDENGNGRYDHWEPGGRGHGGPHGGAGRMGGMNESDR